MTLDPFLNVLDICVRVLKIISDLLLVGVQEARLGRFPALNRHAPTSMLDVSGKITWEGISIGGG